MLPSQPVLSPNSRESCRRGHMLPDASCSSACRKDSGLPRVIRGTLLRCTQADVARVVKFVEDEPSIKSLLHERLPLHWVEPLFPLCERITASPSNCGRTTSTCGVFQHENIQNLPVIEAGAAPAPPPPRRNDCVLLRGPGFQRETSCIH